jgi:hypothetical protein
MYPELTQEEVQAVIKAIRAWEKMRRGKTHAT